MNDQFNHRDTENTESDHTQNLLCALCASVVKNNFLQ